VCAYTSAPARHSLPCAHCRKDAALLNQSTTHVSPTRRENLSAILSLSWQNQLQTHYPSKVMMMQGAKFLCCDRTTGVG
jgi:hypothetical protein